MKNKKVRELLIKQLEHRKKERDIYQKNFIEPINNLIWLIREVLANREPVEKYINYSQTYFKWNQAMFKGFARNCKEVKKNGRKC